MLTVCVCSKLKTSWKLVVFTNKVGKNSEYFVVVFNKAIFHLHLLDIYHLVSNVHSWNNLLNMGQAKQSALSSISFKVALWWIKIIKWWPGIRYWSPEKKNTLYNIAGADLGGGSRKCASPPPPEMTCVFLIQLVFCKKKKLCGLLVLK